MIEKTRRRGLVVALSGVDCAGKSTQRDRLMEALRGWGHTPVSLYTRAGYTPGLRAIKNGLRRLRGEKSRPEREGVSEAPSLYPRRAANLPKPLARKLWLIAALLDLLLQHCLWVRWMRARGRAVVCNRHLLDALVDFRVNFPDDRVEERLLCRLLLRFAVRPDAAFCLLIPAELTLARAREKARFHWETLEVLERRRREYVALARELGVQTIDATRSIEEVALSIRRGLEDTLATGSSSTTGCSDPTTVTNAMTTEEIEPPKRPMSGSPAGARGFIRGSGLFLVGRLIAVIVNFAVVVLAVRYLSKVDYGALGWAQSIAGTGASLVLLGLNRGVSRFTAIHHEREEYGPMFGTMALALGTVTGLGIVVALAALGLRDLLEHHVSSDLSVGLLMVLIALVPLDALDALFETLMAVFAKVRAIFFRRYVLAPLLKLVAVLLVMAFQGSVTMLAMAYVVAGLIGITLYVLMLWRVLAEQGLLAHLRSQRLVLPVRTLFGFSLPVMSTDLIQNLEVTMVVVLLERFRDTAAVAEFKVALGVSVLCLLVFQNSKILFKPYASRLYARGDDAGLGDLYWRSAAWITIVSFPVFAVCVFLGEPLMVRLYDHDYTGAGVLLAILATGKYVNAALGMNTYTLQVHARVWLIVSINVATLVVGLGLCLLLIPRHGVLGGAIATSAAVVFRNAMNQAALARTTSIGFFPRQAQQLYGSVLAGVAVLAVVRLASDSLFVLVPAVAIVSALLPRINRRYLDIANTFPELARVPLVGRFLGVA
ncbi:MAG: oligosaccharide flippase family protein, partial [Planctomycetes bacterium]|nr:oligosaccharide flippase family protein [Planctomycetota bacterium]